MHDYEEVSLSEDLWGTHLDMTYYEEACQKCVIILFITSEDTRRTIIVAGMLHYDKRKNGAHGRVIGADIAILGLAVGDRLEPSV